MPRPSKYNEGFAAGMAAAAEFLRTEIKRLHRQNQASAVGVLEWTAAANHLERAQTQPDEVADEIETVVQSDE